MTRWWLLALGFGGWAAAGWGIFATADGQASSQGSPGPTPGRVVCLAPNLTEIVYALGEGERVAAVTTHCNWPEPAQHKARVGTFWQPSLEAIIGARPDLVLTLGIPQQKALAQRLGRMGHRCLTLEIDTIEQLMQAIDVLDRALDCPPDADRLRASLMQRLDRAGRSAGPGPRPRVLWVVQRQPLRVAGQGTFIDEMIELAGARNAMGPSIYRYPPIGAEQVMACRPEVIIEPAAKADLDGIERSRAIEFWSRFPDIPAVADNRIYLIDADIVSRLGPRTADAVEGIAHCLRPSGARGD